MMVYIPTYKNSDIYTFSHKFLWRSDPYSNSQVTSVNKQRKITVDFFKEHDKAKGFYIPSSNKDVATDFSMEEVVVLEKPKQGYNRDIKLMGVEFNSNIRNNVKYWIGKIQYKCLL